MKLSPRMIDMLISIRDHGDAGHHLRGQSEHGGATGTRLALNRRGLAIFGHPDKLTDEGRAAIEGERK